MPVSAMDSFHPLHKRHLQSMINLNSHNSTIAIKRQSILSTQFVLLKPFAPQMEVSSVRLHSPQDLRVKTPI